MMTLTQRSQHYRRIRRHALTIQAFFPACFYGFRIYKAGDWLLGLLLVIHGIDIADIFAMEDALSLKEASLLAALFGPSDKAADQRHSV